MKRQGYRPAALAVLATAIIGAACGGGGGGGGYSSAPTTSTGGTTTNGANAAAIVRISGAGASPRDVRVEVGQQVMFVNDDSRSHEMLSDPHPLHTGCPEINDVGDLAPGQSRMTAIFRASRNCGFHDNRQDTNAALRGTIVVGQGGDPGTGY
jgi:plastocyanin